jgi:mRNA interferase RelE/StbE
VVYEVRFAPAARRDLKKLREGVRRSLVDAAAALGEDPHPRGHKKLRGEVDLYRLRVGDYRIVYQVRIGELVIVVVKIAHRKDVYR